MGSGKREREDSEDEVTFVGEGSKQVATRSTQVDKEETPPAEDDEVCWASVWTVE